MQRRLWSFWPKSRKARFFLVVLVVAVAIIIGFFVQSAKKPQPPSFDAGGIALKLRQDQIDRLNQDSDHDELKDWEEILYHTDPHNPDTDGDGTPDGEEVKLGRDPAKPNTAKSPKKPDDYFAIATPLTDSAAPAGAAPNLTADFTRTFLRGPLAQMLAGEQPDIDTKNVKRYADKLKGGSVLKDAQRFTATDIHINPATDNQTVIQYLASIQEIFGALNLRGRNELDVVGEVLTNQDYSGLAELAPYPDAYQKSIARLVTLHVPKNHVDLHLSVLNYLSRFKRSTELFQAMETDPILTILAINERLELNGEFNAYLAQSIPKIIAGLKK